MRHDVWLALLRITHHALLMLVWVGDGAGLAVVLVGLEGFAVAGGVVVQVAAVGVMAGGIMTVGIMAVSVVAVAVRAGGGRHIGAGVHDAGVDEDGGECDQDQQRGEIHGAPPSGMGVTSGERVEEVEHGGGQLRRLLLGNVVAGAGDGMPLAVR